jgi:hypothetical protein
MDGTPFVRAPSPCRPGALSADRLLTYFIRTPFALPCRGKTGQVKKDYSCQKNDNATRKGGRQTEAGESLDPGLC